MENNLLKKNDEELMHYGVKGMKWGVRHERDDYIESGNRAYSKYKAAKRRMKNARRSGDTEKYQKAKSSYKKIKKNTALDRKHAYNSTDRYIDKITYGKRGQKRIEKRIQKGQSTRVARGKELINTWLAGNMIADVLTGGAVHKAYIATGKVAVASILKNAAARKAAAKAAKATIKIAQNSKFDPIDAAYTIIN